MADVEKKSRGRGGKPGKKDEQVDVPSPKDAKKRGRQTLSKENHDTSIKESKNDTNGEVPAKRGRGRPPKKGAAAAKRREAAASGGSGRARGRPKNKKSESEPEDSEEDKPADDDDDEAEEE